MDIRKICDSLADRYPQWTTRIVNLDLRDSSSAQPVYNDGRTVFYNSRMFENMTEDAAAFFIAQQVVHLQLNHYARGQGRDSRLWTRASDQVVNCMLAEDGLKPPVNVFLQQEAVGKSAEELYGVLLARSDSANANDTSPVAGPESETVKKAGSEAECKIRSVEDVGLAATIRGLEEMLEPCLQLDYDWFPGSTIRDGMLRDDFRAYPVSHAEILLDTSASVEESLLRTFVKGVRGLLQHDAVLRVGCFDTRFYGFHDISTEQDIQSLELHGSGGTNFTTAIQAFTGDAENRIIFTDGYAEMPEESCDAIWVVYGNNTIHPVGGRVIYVRPTAEKEKHEIDFLIT